MPIDVFLKVAGEEIARHNLRPGRQSDVCAGKLSFAQALEGSLKQWPVRRASPEQRLLWLLAADAIRASRTDGSLDLAGNRFWHEKLLEFRGERLVVRYDPDALHANVHVYTPGGDYIVAAECVEPVGFYDATAAREHAALKKAFMRGTREAMDAERRISITEVAARLAQLEAPTAPSRPDTSVIRPTFGNTALKMALEDEEEPEGERLLLQFARRFRTELRAVEDD